MAIYSTPCLFAAHRAMDTALAELRLSDGRLPAADEGQEIGVTESTRLLAKNITRHHALPGRPAKVPACDRCAPAGRRLAGDGPDRGRRRAAAAAKA